MADDQKQKWVLPPALHRAFDEFITLYETLRDESSLSGKKRPVLIMGSPGVGKTLFSNAFAYHYASHNNISNENILHVNVAAFPETLIESSLFGYVEGAFSGARKGGSNGFVKIAENGILILDEIGELSKEAQAKLLTFIEYYTYYKVGGTKKEESTGTQIIATTNKTLDDGVFRQDFIDRFFPFYIPPLYKRRGDILYHFAELAPDIIPTLAPWEVMAIMAYDWPGNIREMERCCNVIRWRKNLEKKSKRPRLWYRKQPLYDLRAGYTNLDVDLCVKLYEEFNRYGIDAKFLQKQLLRYGIALSHKPPRKMNAFDNCQELQCKRNTTTFGNLIIEDIGDCRYFERALEGLEFFCSLLKRNIRLKANLVDFPEMHAEADTDNPNDFIINIKKKHEKMIQGISSFVDARNMVRKGDDCNPSKMTLKEMTKHYEKRYIDDLLKRTAGNKRAAAKISGLSPSTFGEYCKKYGISYKNTNIRIIS